MRSVSDWSGPAGVLCVVRGGSLVLSFEALLQLIQATLQPHKGIVGDGIGPELFFAWCCDPTTLTPAEQQKPKTEGCSRHRPGDARNHGLECS